MSARIEQLNPTLGEQFLGREEYLARPTKLAPLVALVLAAGLGAISVWLRRVETASHLHFGVPRTLLTVQLVVETLFWVVVAVGLVVPIVLGHALRSEAGGQLAFVGALTLSFAALGTILGATVATLLVRESSMFKYQRG